MFGLGFIHQSCLQTSNLPFVARLDYPNDFFELPMLSEVQLCVQLNLSSGNMLSR